MIEYNLEAVDGANISNVTLNRITLLLSNFLDEEEGNDEALTRPATKVSC